jgi:hypothetical protein
VEKSNQHKARIVSPLTGWKLRVFCAEVLAKEGGDENNRASHSTGK